MAGLVEKDFRLIWCNKQALIFLLIIGVVIGLQNEAVILGWLPFAISILLINTVTYDELDKGYGFLMTLPIDAETYVREKYFSVLQEERFHGLWRGTLHDPRNETADAGRHGFPDSCGIGVSAGYGIVDCIADSAAASIRSRKEQSSHFGGMWCNGSVCHCICGAGKDKCIKCLFIFKPNEWLDTCRNCSGSDSTSHTALLCN